MRLARLFGQRALLKQLFLILIHGVASRTLSKPLRLTFVQQSAGSK
jgi:hypothetical protein